MKIQNVSWLCFVLAGCMLVGCTPKEEDVHPKRRSSRTETLKRYMPKVQALRAQAQLRATPIVQGALLTEQDLKNFVSQTPQENLSSYLKSQQETLQQEVRSSAAQQATQKTAEQLDALRQEMLGALAAASSAEEWKAQLQTFATRYANELNALADTTQAESWTLPTAAQSRTSRENLKKVGETLLSDIEKKYGPVCAQKMKPVLAKVGDDYWLVLSSVKNPEELAQALEKSGKEADAAFEKIVAQYGDPLVSLSPESIAALKARLIESHQAVESQFEKLYGKDAVLKTRTIFEPYLTKADTLLQENGRWSETTARLEELGSEYRQAITALQVALNEELEQAISNAASNPTGKEVAAN